MPPLKESPQKCLKLNERPRRFIRSNTVYHFHQQIFGTAILTKLFMNLLLAHIIHVAPISIELFHTMIRRSGSLFTKSENICLECSMSQTQTHRRITSFSNVSSYMCEAVAERLRHRSCDQVRSSSIPRSGISAEVTSKR